MRWEQSSPRAMILYSGSIRAIGRDSPVFFYHTRRVGTVEPIRIKENNRAKFRFVNPSYQNSFVLLYFERVGQFYLQRKIIVHASLINSRLTEELIYDVTKSANNDAF